jgi:type II secretory pathway component PulC
MRQSLWVVNSSLLFLFLIAQVVFFLLHTPIPRRTSLEPDAIPVEAKKLGLTVSIKNIYEQNDLFGTYIPVFVPEAKMAEPQIPAMPEVPPIIPLKIPLEAEKVFIAPLPVTLRGVMYNYDMPDKSIAIIQFQDSKEEVNYRVGQLIADAQILKIYPNRAIIVRSNGQQETLYLVEGEVTKDMKLEISKDIASMIIPVHQGIYHIPVEKFKKHIKSLGRFIEVLDLTTVYKKGKSVGCRVGRSGKDTLADKLGLKQEDIIEQIDEIPLTDMASRVLVFDHMASKKIGDQFIVKIERSGKVIELKYMLSQELHQGVGLQEPKVQPKTSVVPSAQQIHTIEEQKIKMLEQKVKLAPTVQQIENEERKKIFDARRKQMFSENNEGGLVQPKMQTYNLNMNPNVGYTSGAKGAV